MRARSLMCDCARAASTDFIQPKKGAESVTKVTAESRFRDHHMVNLVCHAWLADPRSVSTFAGSAPSFWEVTEPMRIRAACTRFLARRCSPDQGHPMIGTVSNARAMAETYESLAGMADAIDRSCYRSMARWWTERAREVEAARENRSFERTQHPSRHKRSLWTNGSQPGR